MNTDKNFKVATKTLQLKRITCHTYALDNLKIPEVVIKGVAAHITEKQENEELKKKLYQSNQCNEHNPNSQNRANKENLHGNDNFPDKNEASTDYQELPGKI